MIPKSGYRPDPLPIRDLSGKTLVGHQAVKLWSLDLTDKGFDTFPAPSSAPTASVSLAHFTTPTQQYSIGACGANATADALEVLNARDGLPPIQLSRLFIYSMARMLQDQNGDGKNDLDKDEGTFIRLCFEVLLRFGVCREDDPINGWPYDTSKVFVSPSLKAQRAATSHKISDYYRIRTEGQDRINDMRAALQSGHPIVFGTQIEPSFMDLQGPDTAFRPRRETGYGHAMLCVGYDDKKGFLVKNSWGVGWRVGGFIWFHPDYMTWEATWDLWVPTKSIRF